jgi:hypothetical protein
MGMFFYVVAYICLKNAQLNGVIHNGLYDTLFVGMMVMFLSDAFVMAWIYKDYFGRTITNEVSEIWLDSLPAHEYDKKTHKYSPKKKDNNDEKSCSSKKSDKSNKSNKSNKKSSKINLNKIDNVNILKHKI